MGFRLLGGACLIDSVHRDHASHNVVFDTTSKPFCIACAVEAICKSSSMSQTSVILHDLHNVSEKENARGTPREDFFF